MENGTSEISVLFCETALRNRRRLCAELSVADSGNREETEKEILIRGYERWGRGIVHHLYGGFAFAFREKGGRLFCARDHLGLKSFYYSLLQGNRLLCAADISAIAADPEYRKAVDPEALQIYMILGYPAGEKTLWKGILKLMPGCTLTWDAPGLRIERYDHLSFHPDYGVSEEEWIERIKGTLQEILEEEREANGLSEGNAFLSGGVDSSMLLAASGVRHAASICFSEQKYSEWEAAKETAEWLGKDLQPINLSGEECIAAIPRFVRNAELPLADPSAAAFMLGCERASERKGPWLSGEGADEFFAGYYAHQRMENFIRAEKLSYYGCSDVMEQEPAMRLLRQETAFPLHELVREMQEDASDGEPLSRLLRVDLGLWLEGDILFSVNRSARASGIGLTLPYADRRMLELSASIPADLKVRGKCGKYILRRTAETWLPHEIAFRKKIGFSVPMVQWFSEGKYRSQMERILFGDVSAAFFDQEMLRRCWDIYVNGNWNNREIIYAVYVFVIWAETCFERV